MASFMIFSVFSAAARTRLELRRISVPNIPRTTKTTSVASVVMISRTAAAVLNHSGYVASPFLCFFPDSHILAIGVS